MCVCDRRGEIVEHTIRIMSASIGVLLTGDLSARCDITDWPFKRHTVNHYAQC